MSHVYFASACTFFQGSSRWTGLKRNAIATLHSFRFFGLVFILPGVVGPNLPASFATFAAYGDLATGLLALLALLTVSTRPLFWLLVVAFNSWEWSTSSSILPRHPGQPSCGSRAVGQCVRDPGHLRAGTDDYAHRGVIC